MVRENILNKPVRELTLLQRMIKRQPLTGTEAGTILPAASTLIIYY